MTYAHTAAAGSAALCAASRVPYDARGMQSDLSDRALMSRYRDGDVAAFEILYRRHKDPLYRYLLRQCRQRAAAEDVFQEVWSKIIRARNRYRPTARFSTYLYRVAYHCFIDHVRRNRRHAREIDNDPDLHADSGESPEDATERRLARARLDAALGGLPAEQRDAFLLREEAGLSLDEIAAVTGTNRETAKSRVRYATNKLRAAIDERREDA